MKYLFKNKHKKRNDISDSEDNKHAAQIRQRKSFQITVAAGIEFHTLARIWNKFFAPNGKQTRFLELQNPVPENKKETLMFDLIFTIL